jgi:hypothetical protein
LFLYEIANADQLSDREFFRPELVYIVMREVFANISMLRRLSKLVEGYQASYPLKTQNDEYRLGLIIYQILFIVVRKSDMSFGKSHMP